MARLYHELAADWYQLLTPVSEYQEEANTYHQIFRQNANPAPVTMLELGSGAGHNAYYLKDWYTLTLSDISENMLGLSRKLNPECDHVPGDMRTLRLNKTFDAVFIHDSIMYMTTLGDLKRALSTAFLHCKPGGMVLITPDYTKETFKPRDDHGGSDAHGRGLRYLEWTRDPDPNDSEYIVDYAYLMQDHDGTMRVEYDRHIEGLFSEREWLGVLKDIGFDARSLAGPENAIYFIGHRPPDSH